MNLSADRWLPVIRKDGSRCKISPTEINSEYATNPVIRVDFSRPDFSSFATQLLIGVFQSELLPKTTADLENLLKKPPTKKFLSEAINPAPFELDGLKNRFMQIANAGEFDPKKGTRGVEYLFFGAPGENTVKLGKDWFTRQNEIKHLCKSCAAIALYIRQVSAFPAGVGYYTASRSGSNGAIYTLLTGKTLWETIVFNLLKTSDLVGYGNLSKPCYPWMHKLLPNIVTVKDVHPCYSFWDMPTNIHLNFSSSPVTCSICGEHAPGVSSLLVKNHGRRSEGLSYTTTPYIKKDKDTTRRSLPCAATFTDVFAGTMVFSKELPTILKYLCSVDDQNPSDNIKYFPYKAEQAGLWLFGHNYTGSKYFNWVETELATLPENFPGLPVLVEATLSIAYYLHYYVTRVLGVNAFKSTIRKKPNCLPEPLVDFFNKVEPEFISVLKAKDVTGAMDSVITKAFQVYNAFCVSQPSYWYGYGRLVEDINKVLKKLKTGPISIDLPKVQQESKVIERVMGFDSDLRVAVLKWWGSTNRNIPLRNELRDCLTAEELRESRAAKKLYSLCEVYMNVNNYGGFYKERLFKAAQLSLSIKDHDWGIRLIPEVQASSVSFVKTLAAVQDPLEEWANIYKLLCIFNKINVPDFIETYILWDKKYHNLNKKA